MTAEPRPLGIQGNLLNWKLGTAEKLELVPSSKRNATRVHRLKSCFNTGIPQFEAESTFLPLEENMIGDKNEQIFGNWYFKNVNGHLYP